MKTIEVKAHNPAQPVLLRIILPKRAGRVQNPLGNSEPADAPLLLQVLPLHIEIREQLDSGRPPEWQPSHLLRFLANGPLGFTDFQESAVSLGMSRSTFKRNLRTLLSDGLIERQAGQYIGANKRSD